MQIEEVFQPPPPRLPNTQSSHFMYNRRIVCFYSKGNSLQVCFRSSHVLVMQKILFKKGLTGLYFSYNQTFFS